MRIAWIMPATAVRWIGALALSLLAAGAATADEAAPAQAAIRAALGAWTDAFNAGRQEAVCDLFAPDLVATYQGQPDRDFAGLCELLRSSLRNGSRSFHYAPPDVREILVSGDLAVVRLIWTLSVRGQDGSLLERLHEPGLDVFRRQPDGHWRIARFVAFGMPAPESAATAPPQGSP